ncbi:MAG: hypothetical protein WBA68_00795 [Alteraurantiacibacter sp.]
MATPPQEDYGALVGWTSQLGGEQMTLRLQSVRKPPPHTPEDVHSHFYVLDSNQAAQLANYLFEISGHTKPDRRDRGLLKRLFG